MFFVYFSRGVSCRSADTSARPKSYVNLAAESAKVHSRNNMLTVFLGEL